MDITKIQTAVSNIDLPIETIASQLFPSNKHPRLAFNRALKGDGDFSIEQIEKLASLANLTVTELLSGKWSSSKRGDVFEFANDDFLARLDTKTWVTKVFHKKSMFHESILHSGEVALSVYLDKINQIIHNYLKQ